MLLTCCIQVQRMYSLQLYFTWELFTMTLYPQWCSLLSYFHFSLMSFTLSKHLLSAHLRSIFPSYTKQTIYPHTTSQQILRCISTHPESSFWFTGEQIPWDRSCFPPFPLWTLTSASNPVAAPGEQYAVKRILSVYWIQMWRGKKERSDLLSG